MSDELESLKFPIGREEVDHFASATFSEEAKEEMMNSIKFLPARLEYLLQNLDEHQFDTPYRPGGWTVRHLVHHLADSHINAYTRFRLGLTEDNPSIKPYDQDAWALLPDVQITPTNVSVTLLHSLHTRWYDLLKALKPEEWERTIFHSEKKVKMSLWDLLKSYSWHSKHHLAHISNLRERMNWH